MQKSTKWVLIGSGIVAFLGLWLFLIAFLVTKSLTDTDVEIASGGGGRIAVADSDASAALARRKGSPSGGPAGSGRIMSRARRPGRSHEGRRTA